VPDLLHAPVGALLLEKELGITDGEILTAVSNHTLGAPSMGELDKIIFLADMIEPGRDFPGIERLSCLALRNLDEGMLFALEVTIKYCLQEKRILHPRTIETRNYFLLKMR
ncbi:MAG: HD domain-containing protein, partial [Syntrophomonadaceae bacterium]|nr:HD domain-containing protein [Syntrophomonadaceae bacterium]